MFRRQETEPLSGVFSKAWAFEPSLPKCPVNQEVRCGTIQTSLPRGLREFLDIEERGPLLVRMSVAANDFAKGGYARIFIGVDGADANFLVSVQKVNGELDRAAGKWHLKVEKNFLDKKREIEPQAERQTVYLDALRDVIDLWYKKFEPNDQDSLCRGCTSKIHRLPGSKV